MEPAREFVIALGERLRQLAPNVMADPRVNKSIFRIYRDTRFSKYVTQLRWGSNHYSQYYSSIDRTPSNFIEEVVGLSLITPTRKSLFMGVFSLLSL